MTRINCIPVEELHDKHLVAEYRELPRVYKLARVCPEAPTEYTLGKGHVKFFYNKLGWLLVRFNELVEEMKRRGYKPKFTHAELQDRWTPTNDKLWGTWTPTLEAQRLNRERIEERLLQMRAQEKV